MRSSRKWWFLSLFARLYVTELRCELKYLKRGSPLAACSFLRFLCEQCRKVSGLSCSLPTFHTFPWCYAWKQSGWNCASVPFSCLRSSAEEEEQQAAQSKKALKKQQKEAEKAAKKAEKQAKLVCVCVCDTCLCTNKKPSWSSLTARPLPKH